MDFSAQQESALESVARWLQGSTQVYRLFGYAGTGKTTLAKHLNASHYAAYTGKAAYVLQQKGCNATTIHSLIYVPKSKSTERLHLLQEQLIEDPDNTKLQAQVRAEKENLKRPAFTLNLESELKNGRLLVIDECSMVDKTMAKDILSFGCRVLVLGDPAQLPPVYGCGYFTNCEPDFLLTEVHRQARENPILDLATIVRQQGAMPKQHPCIYTGKLTPDMALGVDQLIVGKNATRRSSNTRYRELLGYTDPLPMVGDKVVCTRNNHQENLLNGALYEVTDTQPHLHDIELDGNIEVEYHPELFLNEELDYWRIQDADCFEYGYALTCHKAQGSQWDSVGVVNESGVFRAQATRWLYTAITRAAKDLWVTA